MAGNYEDKLKDSIKGVFKTMLKGMIKMLIPLLIVVGVMVIIAAAIEKLFDITSKTSAEASSSVHSNVAEQYASGEVATTGIQISEEEIDKYIENLEKEKGLSLDGLYLQGYPESDNPTEEEKEQAKKKYIRQFMEADVASTHLYIGNKGLKGCVYIKKEGSDTFLTFVKYEDLEKMVKEKNEEALKHYSINTEGELVLAISSTGYEVVTLEKDGQPVQGESIKTTTNDIFLRNVNYKFLVEQYSFPFEFLVNLATTTQNPEFVYSLAEDIKNSRIELTIYNGQNSTTTTQIEEWDETIIKRIYTAPDLMGPQSPTPPQGASYTEEPTENHHIKKTTTTVVGDTTPYIGVTYADTWITNQIADYIGTQIINEPDSDLPESEPIPETAIDWTYAPIGANEAGDLVWEATGIKKKNIISNIDVKTSSTEYSISENVVNENKVEQFIEKLDTPYLVQRDGVERSVGAIFVSSSEMLIGLLEGNERTQSVVPIIKYILQEYTGDSYGVENFEYFEFLGMEVSASAFIGDIGWEFTKAWINNDLRKYVNGEALAYTENISKYITEDKTQYICYGTGNTRAYGFDLIHYLNGTYDYVDKYSELGIDITSEEYSPIGAKIDVNIVDEIQTAKYNDCKKTVTEKKTQYAGSEPELTTNQIIILTDMYYRGDIKTEADWQNCFNAYSNGTIITYIKAHTNNTEHRNARVKVWEDEVYQIPGGILNPNNFSNGDFLEVAERIWKFVATNFRNYGGIGAIPPTQNTQIDCSGFVCWVIYEYGYRDMKPTSTSSLLSTNYTSKYGWTEIPVGSGVNPISQIQPGDIMVRYGGGTHHTHIVHHVDGDNVWAYDCGGAKNWINSGGNPVKKNSMYSGKQAKAPGKIIRVTPPPIN